MATISKEINQNVDKLAGYAKYSNDEVGEVCFLLVSLAGYPGYYSSIFTNALNAEILRQLENFKENTYWVSEEVIQKTTVRKLE
jgi:hypothetical protein